MRHLFEIRISSIQRESRMVVIRTMPDSVSIDQATAVEAVAVMCTVLRVELLLRVTAARCLPASASAAACSLCACSARGPLRHSKVCAVMHGRNALEMCTHVARCQWVSRGAGLGLTR